MPIRFRCSYCNRLLGIATRKAGMETLCPHCGYTITVPVPQEQNDGPTERMNLEEVEELLGNAATEALSKSAVAEAPAAPPSPPVLELPWTDEPQPPAPVYSKPAVSPPPAPVASPPAATACSAGSESTPSTGPEASASRPARNRPYLSEKWTRFLARP